MEKKDALVAKESAQKARQEETLQMEMAPWSGVDRIEIRRARMVETMEDEYEINLELNFRVRAGRRYQ